MCFVFAERINLIGPIFIKLLLCLYTLLLMTIIFFVSLSNDAKAPSSAIVPYPSSGKTITL